MDKMPPVIITKMHTLWDIGEGLGMHREWENHRKHNRHGQNRHSTASVKQGTNFKMADRMSFKNARTTMLRGVGIGDGAESDPPSKRSFSSRRASLLSLFNCFSISWLMRFCSLASSLRQHAIVVGSRADGAQWNIAPRAGYRPVITPGVQRVVSTEGVTIDAQVPAILDGDFSRKRMARPARLRVW